MHKTGASATPAYARLEQDPDLAEFVAYWRDLGHPDPERRGRQALAAWRQRCAGLPS